MHFSKLLPFVLSSFACALVDPEQACKCLPSDDCWPSSDEWAQLNATINGRLLHPKPPASVCYPKEPNYDAAACEDVIKHWTSSAWHADDPISPSSPPSDACYPIYPNGTSTAGDPTAGSHGCNASSYPAYVVNASSTQDVQAGVDFARRHSLRLNVKNTGHGRSSIPGSLSIWTHHFREKTFHESFVPEGCANRTNGTLAITFGAGTMDREAFEFAAEHDVVVVGGTDGTVGLVGWGSAGGHGYLTGSYGMGADNFVEATVVTPQGDIIVANENQNSDIFWAIRGGGGGTWGVIISVTVNAYPMPTAQMWSLGLAPRNATKNSEWFEVVGRIFAELPQLKASGLQGYITVAGAPRGLTNAMFAYDQTKEMVEATIEPVLEYLRSQNSTIEVDTKIMSFPKWIDVYHLFNLTQATASGSGSISASRLLPANALTEDTVLFTRFLEAALPDGSELNSASGGRRFAATMASPSKYFDNALNPAWRNTTVHLLVQDSWPASTGKKDIAELTQSMSAVAYDLRQLAPDSGAYINERGDFVPDWQKTLYGENYARLLSIKHKYDPMGVQWCEGCIASDEWFERLDGRFCKEDWA